LFIIFSRSITVLRDQAKVGAVPQVWGVDDEHAGVWMVIILSDAAE
jgi:hypothetical protein